MELSCLQSFENLKAYLKGIDFFRLSGMEAHLRMAPELRHKDIKSRGLGRKAVRSSVLMLFYPSESGLPSIVFIQRSLYDGVHSGQISFPGGRYEKGDPDLKYTALRETHEEIGVSPDMVQVVGKLTDLYIPPSNYLVSPYVAIAEKRPSFSADPREVAEIIEVDLNLFLQKENCVTTSITVNEGYKIQTPCFSINGHIIWGATAMIISEFLSMLESS